MEADQMRLFLIYAANTIVLLAPGVFAMINGTLRLIYPSVIIPLFLCYTNSIAVLARFHNISMRKTTLFLASDNDFVVALVYETVAVLFFYVSIFIVCGRILPGRADLYDLAHDHLPLRKDIPDRFFIGAGVFIVFAVALIRLLIVVHFGGGVVEFLNNIWLFINATRGYFWLHVLSLSAFIMPVVFFSISRSMGLLSLVLVTPVALLSGSKSGFIQIILPILLYFQGKSPQHVGRKTLIIVLIFVILLTNVSIYFRQQSTEGREIYSGLSFPDRIMKLLSREYAYETYVIIRKSIDAGWIESKKGEIIAHQMMDFIPRLLWPNKATSHSRGVPFEFLVYDYFPDDQSFYTQHMWGVFFWDGGFLAMCIGASITGILFGGFYRYSLNRTIARGERMPMFYYLAFAANFKWFVEGSISYSLIYASFYIFILLLWQFLASGRIMRTGEYNL